jgi:hypothetical protein
MMATPAPLQEPPDLSATLGGPLYRMLRRSPLGGSVPRLLRRQAAICVLGCWVPLAVLSFVQGHFLGGIKLSFLHDIETHARFLVSLPVLIMAEMLLYERIRPIIKHFVQRKLVIPDDLPRFNTAVNSALRIHNSVVAEIALLVLVFTVGMWVWRYQIPADFESWYASSQGGHVHLTIAGYWLAFVSVPIFQFILLRWYMQYLVWFWLLLRISQLNLHLEPLHPDQAGGLRFVGQSSVVFTPLLFAHGALLSGQIASHILYHGESLMASEMTIIGFVAFSITAALAPLFSFTLQLIRAKRAGLDKYGALASQYVTDFDQKWLQGGNNDEQLLGSGDIQSLADLGNSFSTARSMRPVPIAADDLAYLCVVTIIPFVPLLLTIMPLDKLIEQAIKLVF